MPSTTGMKGGGFYDAHSAEQRAALDAVLPWLETAIDELPLPKDGPVGMLDLGSSEGGNAVYAMGRLVAALRRRSEVFGRDEAGSASDGLYDVLSDALLDCIDAGTLPRSVYENLILPVYFRSLEELLAPLEADAELAAAFRIDQAETQDVPAPFNVARAATGDVAEWARSYAGFLRAFSEPLVAGALAGVVADGGGRTDRIDDVYRRVEHLLVTDPDRYAFRYVVVAALLTRC